MKKSNKLPKVEIVAESRLDDIESNVLYLTPEEKAAFICDLIARHSDKGYMHSEDTPLELVLLMEADLLDDTGAHGIIMDAWIRATREDVSFETILEHIKKFTLKQMQENPMRTGKAYEIWEDKKELTNRFVESLTVDLYGKLEMK